jgi:aspartyl-tRNA(Asn)/glutamyl-tRNA(Gln) amidotransferase subunit A
MTDKPITTDSDASRSPLDHVWLGDACSLVDAFRAGERSPVEELGAVFAAIEASDLNSFSYLAPQQALAAARAADVSLPFGGVPMGVKELDSVAGWPYTEASFPLKDRRAAVTSTQVARLQSGGAVMVGLTTASEFGGVNLTRTVLNGATKNPWHRDHTPGGSSGGSAAAVAGGLVTLATAGDGGGSIRIPAGFCGLVGLKCTYGRIPKGPSATMGNFTAVKGCVSRSVRDTARWLDVTNGYDGHDMFSLPKIEGWERNLGTYTDDLRGKRVAILMDFGGAFVAPDVAEQINSLAVALVNDLGLHQVEVDATLPSMGAAWSLSGLIDIYAELGDKWPACADDLTPEIRFGLQWADGKYNMSSRIKIDERRVAVNDAMARIFSQVDIILTASNPDVAFGSNGPLPTVFVGKEVGGWNNGRLTAPSNLHGNPAIAIPAGNVRGLPVSLQAISAHHTEALLLDVALHVERTHPWQLVSVS